MIVQSRVGLATPLDAAGVLPRTVSFGALIQIVEPAYLLGLEVSLSGTSGPDYSLRVLKQALSLLITVAV